jgi:hypothetical protein
MRFERAVRTGNPNLVIAAAHELPRPVVLRDALRVLLVVAVADADRTRRPLPASARVWWSSESCRSPKRSWRSRRYRRWRGSDPLARGEALVVLLERHREGDGARYLEQWLRAHNR